MLGVRGPREKGAAAPTGDFVRAIAVRARPPSAPLRYEPGPAEPTHWPLDIAGFLTRGQVRPGDPAESHPGIDIAVPPGTPVRAAGGGVVEAEGTDPAYGQFVLMRHSGGYETMYGHASRILVHVGKGGEVEGDVISREAIIGGEVRGSIRADERIEIQSTSVVHGDVAAKRLLVQEGGEINGVVRMGEGALEEEAVEKVTAGRSY